MMWHRVAKVATEKWESASIYAVRLTTYHHIVPMSRNLGALTLLDPSGLAWPVMGVLYLCFLPQYMHPYIRTNRISNLN
jgi:hypothetical protein